MVRFNFISGFGPDCFLDNVEILETYTNDIGISLARNALQALDVLWIAH